MVSFEDARVYHAVVRARRQLTSRMARVTLGGGDLAAFESRGPDQFVYTFFPLPGSTQAAPIPHDFTWESVRHLPRSEWPVGRYYTVSEHRPEAHEIDLDIVLHGDGPGASFGATACNGDVVAIWGPRIAYEPPGQTSDILLFGDLTALPAMRCILGSPLPAVRYRVVLEVPEENDVLLLGPVHNADVVHIVRDPESNDSSRSLAQSVREVARELSPRTYVWGAGESLTVADLREYFQGLDNPSSDYLSILAYWKRDLHSES